MASVQIDILYDINTSFSNSRLYDKMVKSLSAHDVENNQTIMSEIEAFMKILPQYLENSPIISDEIYIQNRSDNPQPSVSVSYHKMMIASLLYIKVLDLNHDAALIKKILVAHLKNSHTFITKTDNILDYIIALKNFEMLYSFEENIKYCSILFNNPPPPLSEFNRVNKIEERSLYLMTEQSLLREEDIEIGFGYEELMTNILRTFKKSLKNMIRNFCMH
ncbi:MAG: hypothetical protein IE909_11725 [Campylobacterales bacterium]|nr:hypothetical protein [Campylobacterales bacterium]